VPRMLAGSMPLQVHKNSQKGRKITTNYRANNFY
jgi:hypothetical protein